MYNQGHYLAAKLALQGGEFPLKEFPPDVLYKLSNYSDDLPDWQTYDDESAMVVLAEAGRKALEKSKPDTASFCLISATHYIADKLCLAHAEIEKLSTGIPSVELRRRKRPDGVTVEDRIFLNVERPPLFPEIWDELPGSLHNYLEQLCRWHSSKLGCETPIPLDTDFHETPLFSEVYEQAIQKSRILTLGLLISLPKACSHDRGITGRPNLNYQQEYSLG